MTQNTARGRLKRPRYEPKSISRMKSCLPTALWAVLLNEAATSVRRRFFQPSDKTLTCLCLV